MTEARIEYETDDKGRVRPTIIGGNGEVQARLEWYDNQSNAQRGVNDLWLSIGQAAELSNDSPLEVVEPSNPDDVA